MRFVIAILMMSAAVAAPGCSDNPSGPSGQGGSLRLMITDSPYSDARALLVTFSEVSAHRADAPQGEWITLPFADGGSARTCDLKRLVNAQDVLGIGSLAAGHYTQVRLTVSSAALYFENATAGPACAPSIAAPAGRSADLTIPSGEVKLNRNFDVSESGATTMLVDFDGDKSVHQMGNGSYRMSPVIAVVSVQ